MSSDGALALQLPRPEGPRANFPIFLSREYQQTMHSPHLRARKEGLEQQVRGGCSLLRQQYIQSHPTLHFTPSLTLLLEGKGHVHAGSNWEIQCAGPQAQPKPEASVPMGQLAGRQAGKSWKLLFSCSLRLRHQLEWALESF